MFERFRSSRETQRETGAVAVDERDTDATTVREERTMARDEPTTVHEERRFDRSDTDADPDRVDHTPDPVVSETTTRPPVVGREDMATMRERQRDRFGGINWGSAFFGWLSAVGLASILTALLAGGGVALGFFENATTDTDTAETIGLGGGIALLVVLAIAWFSGGYVAGRMSRFDGARQGLAVWLWSILAAIVLGVTAAIGGSEYNVLDRLNLPSIPISGETLSSGGAIAAVAAVLATLLFAILGGKVGERYHRRVDRVATRDYEPAR